MIGVSGDFKSFVTTAFDVMFFILFLFFAPLGCSVESSAIEDVPNIAKSETTFIESSIENNCTGEPLLLGRVFNSSYNER
ncbi:MAG: hypothetical protein ACTH5O_10390 [Psychrobacter sp.]